MEKSGLQQNKRGDLNSTPPSYTGGNRAMRARDSIQSQTSLYRFAIIRIARESNSMKLISTVYLKRRRQPFNATFSS